MLLYVYLDSLEIKKSERETRREKVRETIKNSGKGKEGCEEGENEDGNDWTEVRNRKDKGKETNIYVTNLPQSFTSTMLWKTFMKIDGLTDAFVPNKRNELGRRFGFLRFRRVLNESALLQRINNTRLEGIRIQANVSKYNRDGKADFEKRQEANNQLKQNRYAGKPQYVPRQTTAIGTNGNSGWGNAGWGRSFRDVLRGASLKQDDDVLFLGNKDISGLSKLAGRAFIGEAKNMEVLSNLHKLIQESIKVEMNLRYIGANQ